MKENIVRVSIALLIAMFLGASFLMIAPIENTDAWLMHWCCTKWEPLPPVVIFGVLVQLKICVEWEVITHWNPLPHQFSCS